MARWLVAALVAAAVGCAGCASGGKYDPDKEWARAECGRIIDDQDRARCLRRVDGE